MHRTKLVGIVNITPDSFSDGGKYFDTDLALSYILNSVEQGASVIDIGAESTRPGAERLDPQEEWKRCGPLLKALTTENLPIPISLDTYHPETARKALDLGIAWINDVSGVSDQMIQLLQQFSASIVLMHNLGIPTDKNITIPHTEDPLPLILNWGKSKISQLVDAGIAKQRIIFDPGIGFGKTAEQSLKIIRQVESFKTLGTNIMVGHSRKSFFNLISKKQPIERDIETHITSIYLAKHGVDYLRVHDVEGNARALNTAKTLEFLDD